MLKKDFRRLICLNKSCTFFCQAQKQLGQPPKAPAVTEMEFQPFKFNLERDALMYGYTMQEMYGKKYGFRHSQQIKAQMLKDSVLLGVALFAFSYWAFAAREKNETLHQDYKTYAFTGMNQVRAIPERARAKEW